jgi:Xaa-Pro aminopeptidase
LLVARGRQYAGAQLNEENDMSAERMAQARSLLATWDADGVLIGSPANRRWLSGFTGSNAWLLVTADKAWLATDFRYYEQAQNEAPLFTLHKMEGGDRTPAGMLAASNVQTVVIESSYMTVNMLDTLREKVSQEIKWLGRKQTLEPLRAVKNPAELALIRRAAALGDQAVAMMAELARPGISERALAWELEKRMREAGADGVAFEVIVASGPNSALPHHRPGDRRLQSGDAVVVDLGALVKGYHSDLTRSFFLGESPPDGYMAVYDLVARAQENVLSNMRPGMTSQAVDALARDLIAAAGHEDHFGHGLGHGVGLEIHEEPRLSPYLAETVIPAGVVVTVEPGVYLPGRFGVRIEDLVVLYNDGLEIVSQAPKEPMLIY